MFNQFFPEGDLSRGGVMLDGEGGARLGNIVLERDKKGVVVTERLTTRDGVKIFHMPDKKSYLVAEQTRWETELSLGKQMMATFDRPTGLLTSLEASLCSLTLQSWKAGLIDQYTAALIQQYWADNEDFRIKVSFETEKPGVTFFKTNLQGNVVQIFGGAKLEQFSPGAGFPDQATYRLICPSPLLGFESTVAASVEGLAIGVKKGNHVFIVPVTGRFDETIGVDTSIERLLSYFKQVFPSTNFGKVKKK